MRGDFKDILIECDHHTSHLDEVYLTALARDGGDEGASPVQVVLGRQQHGFKREETW